MQRFNFQNILYTLRTSFSSPRESCSFPRGPITLLSSMRLVLAVCSFSGRGTRTVVSDVKVENRIGDAIVHRAIRAHQEGTPWKCCIIIPVLPGFPFPLDHSDAGSVSMRLFQVTFATLLTDLRSVSLWSVRTGRSAGDRTRSSAG